MSINFKQAVALSCMLFPLCSWAESTAEDLMGIEARTAVLKAKARQVEVQAQIAAREAEIERLQAVEKGREPSVRAIEGIGATLYATLVLDNGSTTEVKAGDVLPNGMKVQAVTRNAVVVEDRNKRKVTLSKSVAPMPVRAPVSPSVAPNAPPAPRAGAMR